MYTLTTYMENFLRHWPRAVNGGVQHRTFGDEPFASILVFARIRAIAPGAHDSVAIVYHNVRGKWEKIFNSWQLRQNSLGWVLNRMLFASIERTHDTDKSFLNARHLISVPKYVGRSVQVDDMVFGCLISLFVSKVIAL